MEANEKKFLNDVCKQIRRDIIEAIGSAGNGHVGGSLSIVEVLSVLYYKQMNVDPKNPQMADRDRLVPVSYTHLHGDYPTYFGENGAVEQNPLDLSLIHI